jgi:pilus assembly protein CpaE
VWPGGLRTAAAALGQGQSPRILIMDLDETPYPAGAIHELAAVCEVGTVVIALGSDDSARSSREILLAGVSDYLVKPVTAAAVREAAVRAAGSAANGSAEGWLVGFAGTGGSGATTLAAATALLAYYLVKPVTAAAVREAAVRAAGSAANGSAEGWLVGFAGTGGSGATTLAAATALLAAERGRYVSVLDLNRTFSALSFLLDVEPAGGLVDLLSTVARASLHPDMVDGMRAVRSDRIAVYGYPWSVESPPLAPVWAVCELLVELQRRSHLVIVDGMDDPATRQTLLAMVDARVLVVEPTATGAASAIRMMARLGPILDHDWPFVLVQNHTREFKARAGGQALGRAGVAAAPDVVVPFEPTLPSVTDRGWPQDRLPRTLREPLTKLTDRVLASAGSQDTMTAGPDPAGAQAAAHASPAPAGRSRSLPGSSARPGPSAVRRALRRLLPLRTARPRAA